VGSTRAGHGGAKGKQHARGVRWRVRPLLAGVRARVLDGASRRCHGGARLVAMGGGERGARGWAGAFSARGTARRSWYPSTRRASLGYGDTVIPCRAAARRARGLGGRGGARREGAKARSCPYGRDARVMGCTRASSVARTGARARACTRRGARHGAAATDSAES
jgi:hypothetical protein